MSGDVHCEDVTRAPCGRRKPYTLRDRRRMADQFGHRPTNNWQGGDLPAPWAEGDVVVLVAPVPDEGDGWPRMNGMEGAYFVVCYATSVDEGDAWYFRVWDGIHERRSDRLHVAYADRSTWDHDVDWMGSFRLVECADPEGLALRERMLDEGWSFKDATCPTCGGTGTLREDDDEPIGHSGRHIADGER